MERHRRLDFLTAISVVIRRWYIVLPVLLASAFITVNVVKSVDPTYQASGSVLLASPGLARSPNGPAVNPFTNIDYSSGVVASIVAQLMQDRTVKERLVAAGADPNYTLSTPSAPTISVESTAARPALAVDTVNLVIRGIQDELATRQRDAGGPPETWIRAIVLTSPTEADRLVSGKIRALTALIAVGLVAAVTLAFLTESVSVGRRRRASERAANAEVASHLSQTEARPDGTGGVAGTRAESL